LRATLLENDAVQKTAWIQLVRPVFEKNQFERLFQTCI
jgi:hypothetical protein